LNIDDILATSLIKYDRSADVCGIYNIESGKQIAKCLSLHFY